MTCRHDLSVAAYALGTLEPAERAAVAGHLPECRACRGRLEELGGLPGLLSRVPAEVAERGLPRPDDRLLDQVLASASVEAAHRRRRLVAAAAAAVLVVGAAGTAVLARQDATPPTMTVAGAQGPVQARVVLTPADDGTGLALELSGVPPALVCRLVAVADDGRRDVAATWRVSYTGQVTVTGHTAVPADRITGLAIETADDQTLVQMPVRR